MKDLSSILIAPDADFREVLRVIDGSALGFVLVVDPNRRLLGTITDGDVRRALMQADAAPQDAQGLMNPNPLFLTQDTSYEERQTFLTKHKITFVPLLGKDRIVLSVAASAHLPGNSFDDVAVVVMAGGLGSRLGDLTKQTPKPLLQIDGEPILTKIVRRFRDEGFENFVICINYKGDMIREHYQTGADLGVQISYVEEEKRLGTGGALSLIDAQDYKQFFVTNADILCSTSYREMLEFHLDQKSRATMAVREHEVQIPFGVVETEGFEIRSLREKPTYKHFINAGYYVIDRSTLTHVPRDEFFDMPSLFDLLRTERQRTRIYPTSGDWIDIGRPEDLQRARSETSDP